jgi:hypothetical protein
MQLCQPSFPSQKVERRMTALITPLLRWVIGLVARRSPMTGRHQRTGRKYPLQIVDGIPRGFSRAAPRQPIGLLLISAPETKPSIRTVVSKRG